MDFSSAQVLTALGVTVPTALDERQVLRVIRAPVTVEDLHLAIDETRVALLQLAPRLDVLAQVVRAEAVRARKRT